MSVVDTEGILEIIRRIGVGADMRQIARHVSLLKLAANLGILSNKEVERDIRDCEQVLAEEGRSNLEQFINMRLEESSDWPKYSDVDDKNALDKIRWAVREQYTNNQPSEVCFIKKKYGAPIVALYSRGTLSCINVQYCGKVGQQINLEEKSIKGLPKYIDISSNDIVRVYGTLSLQNDTETREPSVAVEIAARIAEDNLEGLEFTAELVSGVRGTISGRLTWADSVGFNIPDLRVMELDIYNINEYLGLQGIELFDYNEDEVIDCIIVTMNDVEHDNYDILENNCFARLIGESNKSIFNSVVKNIRLDIENGDCSVIAEVEPFKINSGEVVSEIVVDIDDAYSIDIGDEITIEERSNELRLERGLGNE